MKRELEALLSNAPPGRRDRSLEAKLPHLGRHFLKVAELMDHLGRLDQQSQEVRVDETSLRNLIREASPGSADVIVEQLRRLPGSVLTKSTAGTRPITWEELRERTAPKLPSNPSRLTTDGLTPYSSSDEVRAALQRKDPSIPDTVFDLDDLYRRFRALLGISGEGKQAEAVTAAALPSAVWDCMVRNLGFWGALAVLAVAVALLIGANAVLAMMVTLGEAASLFWFYFWAWLWEAGGWAVTTIALAWATIFAIINCIIQASF